MCHRVSDITRPRLEAQGQIYAVHGANHVSVLLAICASTSIQNGGALSQCEHWSLNQKMIKGPISLIHKSIQGASTQARDESDRRINIEGEAGVSLDSGRCYAEIIEEEPLG